MDSPSYCPDRWSFLTTMQTGKDVTRQVRQSVALQPAAEVGIVVSSGTFSRFTPAKRRMHDATPTYQAVFRGSLGTMEASSESYCWVETDADPVLATPARIQNTLQPNGIVGSKREVVRCAPFQSGRMQPISEISRFGPTADDPNRFFVA